MELTNNKKKDTTILVCDCSSYEHQIIIEHNNDDNLVYCYIHLTNRNFWGRLKAGLKYIPFEITSATRTIESVKRLEKDNDNAIKNSAHLKGKTFDIGYINFANYPKQRALFISVLKSFREENKCFVKYEIGQKCFHVTAN